VILGKITFDFENLHMIISGGTHS